MAMAVNPELKEIATEIRRRTQVILRKATAAAELSRGVLMGPRGLASWGGTPRVLKLTADNFVGVVATPSIPSSR